MQKKSRQRRNGDLIDEMVSFGARDGFPESNSPEVGRHAAGPSFTKGAYCRPEQYHVFQ
jgi:hypothetical protein